MRALVVLAAACLLLVPASARADPLELGPLTVKSGFEKAERFDEEGEQSFWGKAAIHQHSASRGESGVFWRVVEIVPDKPVRSLAGYLAKWRASHGCTAKEVKDLPVTTRDGKAVPQLTFEGSCKGGDSYVLRVLLLDGRGYELHADARRLGGQADLRAEMKALLENVALRDPDPPKKPGEPDVAPAK